MALYRHTATGFLGEFASNPGAGYTAVTAMPTDTVANRVTWWRALDTYGQTSSWHPSVTRDPQDPGEATISIQFSQDAALISSDPDGTVTNPRDPGNTYYLGASTEVRVYRGLTDVTITEGWTLTKVEEGCTSTLAEAGGLYTLKITDIPLLATQSGYVRITATREGSGTFVKDFRFLKVFQGQDGTDGFSGLVMDLDNENQTVAAQKDGTWISGTTATTTARLYLGATQLTSGITWSVTSATTGITYTTTDSTSHFTVTVTGMVAALATGTITVQGVLNEVPYTQVFTISKANAGSDGTPATVYWLQTSASAIAKDAAGTYNPTSITLNAYSQTGTNSPIAYTGRFRVQTQATLNGAWTTRYDSAGNESSASYSIPASIVAVKVLLYQAGGTTILLDQETLPVVSDGAAGAAGSRGSRQIVITGTSNWSDTTAWDGIVSRFGGTAPVLSDMVTIVNTATATSTSKFCTANTARPGSWEVVTEYINGNLLVTGTVGANAIAANAITAGKIAAGAVNLTNLTFTPVQTSSVVASINASAEGLKIAGSLIRIDGNVTFGSGYDPSTKLSAGGAATDINNNTTTINGNKITTGTLTADKITGGTIGAGWIYLADSSSHISSANWGAGNDWVIRGDGYAAFNNVDIRGRLNAGDISAGTLNVDRIATSSINGVKIGTGYNGVNTTNLVPGAITWAYAHNEYGTITPPFNSWIVVTDLYIPANSNRGTLVINITASAKNTWVQNYFVNMRISRPGWSAYAADASSGCIDTVTLCAADTGAGTGAFTYRLEIVYARRTGSEPTSFTRVIGGSIMEYKR